MVKTTNFINKKVWTIKPKDEGYEEALVNDYETNCKKIFEQLIAKDALNPHITNIGIYYQTHFKTIVLVIPRIGTTTTNDSYKECLYRLDNSYNSTKNTSISKATIDENGNLILEM